MVILKKLLKLSQKITFFNHINLKMILDRLMMIMILAIIYALSIFDIRKLLKVLNQQKWNLNLMESFPLEYMVTVQF